MNSQLAHLHEGARESQPMFISGPQSYRAGPDPVTAVLMRRGDLDTGAQGRSHVEMTEIGVRHLHAKECQAFPGTTRHWEEPQTDPSHASGRNQPS